MGADEAGGVLLVVCWATGSKQSQVSDQFDRRFTGLQADPPGRDLNSEPVCAGRDLTVSCAAG